MTSSASVQRQVLVLNQYAKPLHEPGGTRHVELFGRLSGWRHTIVVGDLDNYTRQRFQTTDPHFVRVRVPSYRGNDHQRVANWISYSLGALRAALRQRPRPDVVYASSPHILTPVAGWLAARIRRSRFVLEIRDLWPETLVSMGYLRSGSITHRLLRALERWLYRRADAIVVVAEGWRSYLVAQGVDESRIEWVSNGAEPADFTLRPEYRSLRSRVPVTGRLVVYAGAHGPLNGLDLLLDAAAELPEHTFVLIGDGLEKAHLVERAHAEQLGNVHFLDTIPKRELAGIIGDADVGVHVLANAEIFQLGASPNKLYDYLAAGLPVVTNCPDEPQDIVLSAGAGIAVGPNELVAGLRKLLGEDTATLRAMGGRGRRYIEEHRSRTVMAARLQRLLDAVVVPGSSRADRRRTPATTPGA
ncbi:glycosyltransferase family 4 protein [Micromonospora sp. CPCC 206060]|uniref:glycosyltransferase family 4 protein n=1 Tax=Micromonospora sp. CPCC 206060 TaxID=3122406 RepID=UPI002FF318B0